MIRSFLKAKRTRARILYQFYRRIASRIRNEYHNDNLRQPAVVFSPHFDDETLGCGGTIIKKKRAGSDVKIVFMTDGSKSHSHLIAEDDLKAIRASEGLEAARSLGLNTCDVFLLGFEETRLCEHVNAAIDTVTEILWRTQPLEVFVPYQRETHLDHFITNRIVVSALQTYDREVIIYEYPIWFWHHWPLTSVPTNTLREILSSLKRSLISPASLLTEFNCSVYVGDVLTLKRAALSHYKSQMTRLISDPRWRTLRDVSNGEFLDFFFQEYEVFRARAPCMQKPR